MKNARLLKRTFGILLGAVGLTTFMSACHKERDCKCSQTQGGETYTAIVSTKEQCWELDKELEYDNEVIYTIECEKD